MFFCNLNIAHTLLYFAERYRGSNNTAKLCGVQLALDSHVELLEKKTKGILLFQDHARVVYTLYIFRLEIKKERSVSLLENSGK